MPIIKIPDVSKGANLDLTPEELEQGVWSRVENMRFANGYASKYKGMAQVFADASTTPQFIVPFQTDTQRYWIHAGVNAVFADDGTTRTEITPTTAPTGTTDDRWSAATLGGILVATNGVDAPYFWGGDIATDFVALTNWNAIQRCQSIHAFKNYLVALDITKAKVYPKTISSITRVTTTATLTTATAHELVDGDSITVVGATPTEFNGTYTVTVTSPTTLTYTMSSTPSGNATVVGTYSVNTTKRFPYMVKWSGTAVPGALPSTWDETDVTKDAGENDLSETPDLIIDALPLGDSLVIYKERSAYSMRFIGQPFIFQFQRMPGEYGMLAKGCGAVTPKGHVILANGDVILNTGQGMESIADGVIRRYIFSNIDSTNYKRAFVCTNPQRNEVLVCFPFNGSSYCDKAAVWNWQSGAWTVRDLNNATYGSAGLIDLTAAISWSTDTEEWDDDATTWNENEYAPNESRLLISTTSDIRLFDASTTDDGVRFTGLLERKGIQFDDGMSNKLIRAVHPRIDAASNVQVMIQVGATMFPDSDPIWSTPVPFRVGQDIKVDTFAQGRFLALRIYSEKLYRLRSLDIDVVPTGAF